MTKIKFFKEKDYYYGFKASGHADGGEYERIVCAGISALTETFYFSLIELLGFRDEDIEEEVSDGFLSIKICENYIDDKVQFAFKYLILGLKKIDETYPRYLKLEVWYDKV